MGIKSAKEMLPSLFFDGFLNQIVLQQRQDIIPDKFRRDRSSSFREEVAAAAMNVLFAYNLI